MNDPKALYKVYADWTGHLHHWVQTQLGRHIDCEYLPDSYQFRLYSGWAEGGPIGAWATVPSVIRPEGEAQVTIQLPRPLADPTQAELDAKFRELCLAAAQVLEIDLGKHALTDRNQR